MSVYSKASEEHTNKEKQEQQQKKNTELQMQHSVRSCSIMANSLT